MKRKVRLNSSRFFSCVIAVILVSSILSSTTASAAPYSSYRMEGGIGNVYMYIDDTGSRKATYWQNLIKAAVDNWMYTGVGANNFYCQGYVSSGVSGSKMDWYARDVGFWGTSFTTTLAGTRFYTYDLREVFPWSSNCNWYSAEININDLLLRRDEYSNDDAIGVFIHEMGHGFGMDHVNNRNSIMFPAILDCNVRRVQRVDNDVLNSMY